MFLSIIIPTYNDEKYLDECLASCLTQDIDDYEIICVDDGSTDRTPQMLDEYAARYPRISVIHKEHGVGNGRNIGMERAKGEYLWFVDHDDLVEDNCLGHFRKIIQETDAERLEFPYYDIYDSFTDDELQRKRTKQLKPETNLIPSTVWTSITQREFLLRNNIWPHSKRLGDLTASYGMDTFYVKECMRANPKIAALTDRPYYYYRHYRGQSMQDYSEQAMMLRIDTTISFVQMYRNEYEEALHLNGEASFDKAMEFVVSARGCVQFMNSQNKKYRKICMAKMRECGIFPLKLPKVYTDTYSCWDCIKAKNGMGPLLSIAFYHSCSPVGYHFYRVLNYKGWLSRLRSSEKYRNIRTKIYELEHFLKAKNTK